MNIYYVYAYIRKDGSPYYIGKGKGDRAFSKTHITKPPKDKSRIIFLYKSLNEEEAFSLEKEYIYILGRKDNGTGILRNLTDGGEGNSGRKASLETKLKMSQTRKGRVFVNHGKISRDKIRNANLGKRRSEETKRKMSEAAKRRCSRLGPPKTCYQSGHAQSFFGIKDAIH